jgi:hypothetical protein
MYQPTIVIPSVLWVHGSLATHGHILVGTRNVVGWLIAFVIFHKNTSHPLELSFNST